MGTKKGKAVNVAILWSELGKEVKCKSKSVIASFERNTF